MHQDLKEAVEEEQEEVEELLEEVLEEEEALQEEILVEEVPQEEDVEMDLEVEDDITFFNNSIIYLKVIYINLINNFYKLKKIKN